jgi:hypothetical protein
MIEAEERGTKPVWCPYGARLNLVASLSIIAHHVPEGLIHRSSDLILHARQNVGVGVEGDGNRCVTKPVAYNLGMSVLGEQVGCVAMAQTMESHFG